MALFDPKAKTIAAYQKSIDDKNASISRYFDEVGRLYYTQFKDMNVDNTKDINTRCEAITRLNNEIEDLKLKILFEKGLKLCPNCRTENNLEYAFCYKCGARFDEAKPAEPKAEAPAAPAEEPAAAPAEEAKTEE